MAKIENYHILQTHCSYTHKVQYVTRDINDDMLHIKMCHI